MNNWFQRILLAGFCVISLQATAVQAQWSGTGESGVATTPVGTSQPEPSHFCVSTTAPLIESLQNSGGSFRGITQHFTTINDRSNEGDADMGYHVVVFEGPPGTNWNPHPGLLLGGGITWTGTFGDPMETYETNVVISAQIPSICFEVRIFDMF